MRAKFHDHNKTQSEVMVGDAILHKLPSPTTTTTTKKRDLHTPPKIRLMLHKLKLVFKLKWPDCFIVLLEFQVFSKTENITYFEKIMNSLKIR